MSNKQTISDSAAWARLNALADTADTIRIADLFKDDPERFAKHHLAINGLVFDFSKHLLNGEILDALLKLQEAANVTQKREALFNGDVINISENRSALHSALRGTAISDVSVSAFVQETRTAVKTLSENIRNDTAITDIIHIGIGGSNIAPALVVEALQDTADGPRVHFISSIDGYSIDHVLEQCRPEATAVIVASKTFTTHETMKNAELVCDWLDNPSRIYAITKNKEAAIDFGVRDEHILPMKDWIGGRFSVWGSIGFPIAIALGYDAFESFLDGAAAADEHFLSAKADKNIPIIMALLGIWYRNFMDCRAHAVLPYSHALAMFPLYLQQVDMESNGKGVDNDGTFIEYPACPIVFGETGTDAQHTFMQCLHQGADIVPADFILLKKPNHKHEEHHAIMNANALAQSKSLMEGHENMAEPHRHFPGNRPSSTIILEQLDAHNLGLLMALYEHKIFVQGAIWGINSFDQWGVELGKSNAKTILEQLQSADSSIKTDSSTKGLLDHLRSKNTKNL